METASCMACQAGDLGLACDSADGEALLAEFTADNKLQHCLAVAIGAPCTDAASHVCPDMNAVSVCVLPRSAVRVLHESSDLSCR